MTTTTRKVRALVIHPDGHAEVKRVNPDLPVLQAVVGGNIEGIYPRDSEKFGDWHGYVDEDGKFKALDVNVVATRFAGMLGWMGYGMDVLCGPVILLGTDGPEEADLPQPVIDAAERFWHGLMVRLTFEQVA